MVSSVKMRAAVNCRGRGRAAFPGALAAAALALSLAAHATAARAAACPNEAQRRASNVDSATLRPYSTLLPECRAYEMVSPLQKSSRGVSGINEDLFGAELAAAPGGPGEAPAVAYGSPGLLSPTEGTPEPLKGTSIIPYLARRSESAAQGACPQGRYPCWITAPLAPPASLLAGGGVEDGYEEPIGIFNEPFSAEAACNTAAGSPHALACLARAAGAGGLATGPFTVPVPQDGLYEALGAAPGPVSWPVAGASADLSQIVFQAPAGVAFAKDSGEQSAGESLYEVEQLGAQAKPPSLVNVGNAGTLLGEEGAVQLGGRGLGAWSAAAIDPGHSPTAISCPAATRCVATDNAGAIFTASELSNTTAGAAVWSRAEVDPGHALTAISCPTATLCVATDNAGHALVASVAASSELAQAGKWAAVAIDGSAALTAISCPTATLCVATDNAGHALVASVAASSELAQAGKWAAVAIDGSAALTAISCPTATLCVATDNAGHALVASVAASSELAQAGKWAAVAIDGASALTAISCPSETMCAAADKRGQVLTAAVTATSELAEPSKWAGAQADPSEYEAAAGVSERYAFSALACPSTTLCLAADDASGKAQSHAFTSSEPTGPAGTWSRLAGLAALAKAGTITAISCPAALICAATDSEGELLLSSARALGGAVSEDGKRVLFTASKPATAGGQAVIYARAGGTTTAISQPASGECTEEPACSVPYSATYLGSSEDGQRVYFSSAQKLIDGASIHAGEAHLYEYDGAFEPHIRVLAGAAFRGLVALSPKETHLYFATYGVLDPEEAGLAGLSEAEVEARLTQRNGEGEEAQPGVYNLYLYTPGAGTFAFAARLSFPSEPEPALLADEAALWRPEGEGAGANTYRHRAQSTPDGRYLLFDTAGRPKVRAAEAQTDEGQQIYRYDAQGGTLVRISVGHEREPNGHNGNGFGGRDGLPALLAPAARPRFAAYPGVSDWDRAISSNGSYVVFETAEALQQEAANEGLHPECTNPDYEEVAAAGGSLGSASGCDVYLWHECEGESCADENAGEVSLISPAPEAEEEGAGHIYPTISATGSDLYFASATQIVPQDSDQFTDIYDARIYGGIPYTPPSSCTGESCRPEGSSPRESFPLDFSAGYFGLGNVAAPATPATPTLAITRHAIRPHALIITLKSSQAGALTISGRGVRKLHRGLAAGAHKVEVTLTKLGRRLLGHHRKLTVKAVLRAGGHTVAAKAKIGRRKPGRSRPGIRHSTVGALR